MVHARRSVAGGRGHEGHAAAEAGRGVRAARSLLKSSLHDAPHLKVSLWILLAAVARDYFVDSDAGDSQF